MHELTRDPHVRHTWGKTPDKKELYRVTACSVGTFRTGQGGWYWKKTEQWSALLGDGGEDTERNLLEGLGCPWY